eukprot:3179085-Alexandrium_andersonii.AAC.1
MSASLVGSEMCIRDRGSNPPQSAIRHAKSAKKRFTRSNLEMRGPREAVSYTHLTLPTICSV